MYYVLYVSTYTLRNNPAYSVRIQRFAFRKSFATAGSKHNDTHTNTNTHTAHRWGWFFGGFCAGRLAEGDVDGDVFGGIDIYVLLCMKYATSESACGLWGLWRAKQNGHGHLLRGQATLQCISRFLENLIERLDANLKNTCTTFNDLYDDSSINYKF